MPQAQEKGRGPRLGDLGQVPSLFGPLLPLKWVWKSGPDHRIASRSKEKLDARCSEPGTKQPALCPYEIPQWLPRSFGEPRSLSKLQLQPAHSTVARPLAAHWSVMVSPCLGPVSATMNPEPLCTNSAQTLPVPWKVSPEAYFIFRQRSGPPRAAFIKPLWPPVNVRACTSLPDLLTLPVPKPEGRGLGMRGLASLARNLPCSARTREKGGSCKTAWSQGRSSSVAPR